MTDVSLDDRPVDEVPPASPRADLVDSAVWLALGAAVLVGSITMDRLADQDVDPWTAPGLLPGLLGIALMLLGTVLLFGSLRRGALARRQALGAAAPPRARLRVAVVIGLCVLFDTVLVGHGLPFWAAAAVFVTAAVLMLQPRGATISPRSVITAAFIGLCAGGAVSVVFQQIFLVRLP